MLPLFVQIQVGSIQSEPSPRVLNGNTIHDEYL
jgi:hypothetical protein